MLENHKSSKPGELWDTPTQTQKDEILLAQEESEVESTLIPIKKIFNF